MELMTLVRIMILQELQEQLHTDLDKGIVSSTVLLDRFSFIDDKSKITGAYSDPRYIPFYYYLGKKLSVKSLIHAGFGLGLVSGAFLMGCHTVEHFLAFQDSFGEFYFPRLGIKNIKSKYKGHFDCYTGKQGSEDLSNLLKAREWDISLVTDVMSYDQHRQCLDIVWENLKHHGLLVVDHISHEPNSKAFEDFCKIVNREPIKIKTRYGVSILER